MSVQVNLPPGCSGFTMADGTNYGGRKGGTVTVSDEHAPHIRRQVGGDAGLVGHASFRALGFGTKKGMRCPADGKVWNAWTEVCHSCGGATEPE